MGIPLFNKAQFKRGEKFAFDIPIEPWVKGESLSILLVRGLRDGPTLVAIAGVHGDEYEGVRALLDTFQSLDPAGMTGDLLAVPVANPPAFWSGTRTSPLDQANLARSFPGSLNAGPTAAIAYVLANSVIAYADFLLDLHSAGAKMRMPTMVGYDAFDERSRAAALAFGTPVVWGHPEIGLGRTITFAKERGIPWLYTEARGAGWIHTDDLRTFVVGIENLLRHLGILPGTPKASKVEVHLWGKGDLDDSSVIATKAGLLIPEVALLEKVTAQMRLGRTVNLHSESVETFYAPSDGVIAAIREWPAVQQGDLVFFVTGLADLGDFD
jgi:predicted deacylase